MDATVGQLGQQPKQQLLIDNNNNKNYSKLSTISIDSIQDQIHTDESQNKSCIECRCTPCVQRIAFCISILLIVGLLYSLWIRG